MQNVCLKLSLYIFLFRFMNEFRIALEDLTGFKNQKTVEPLTKAAVTDDSWNKSTVKYNNRSSSPKYSSGLFDVNGTRRESNGEDGTNE